MKFLILTLFPEMFQGPFAESIVKRAKEEGIVEIETKNIRDFGIGKYRKVDDTPYGGGAGMVLRVDILAEALRWAKDQIPEAKIVSLTPQGERLTQTKCKEFANDQTPLILLCGHFEGIDERVREIFVDEEISLGDFVLTGGEIPAMALIDSLVRLLPGAIGNEASPEEESFSAEFAGRLEYPHYTRPEEFEGLKVPEVLLSGHHAEIRDWRLENLRGFTAEEQNIFQIRRQYFAPEKPWKTRRVLLRTHLPEDQGLWLQWLNDPEVMQYLKFDLPYDPEDAVSFFAEKERDLNGLFLTVIDRTSKLPIGHASLICEEDFKSARYGLYLGAKEIWGQGYGTATTEEILKIGFEILNLEKIKLEVFTENLGAFKMYERCGFKLIGELKNEVRKKDSVHDVFLMEILREEWEEGRKEKEQTQKFLDLRSEFGL